MTINNIFSVPVFSTFLNVDSNKSKKDRISMSFNLGCRS